MDSIFPTAEDLFLMIEEVFKPAERHVRFAAEVSTIPISGTADTNVRERWYTKEEVIAFKLKVQNLTMSVIRGEKRECDKDNVLGLEHYYDLARLKHKQLAVAHVLKAQKLTKGRLLAKIAHDSSTWHKEIAFVQGLRVYCAVYDPSLASSVPAQSLPPPLPKLSIMSKKRVMPPLFVSAASKRRRATLLSAE